jgi:hypothetical protein
MRGTARGSRASARATRAGGDGGRRDEVHPAERGDERLEPGGVARAVLVEQGDVPVADVAAVRGAVAAHVADVQRVGVQPAAGAALDLGPHLVAAERAEVLLPAHSVADVRGGLEREHPEAEVAAVAQHGRDLVEVPRRDRHVVREVRRDAVLALEALEHRAEAGAVLVELLLAAHALDAAPPEHRRVEVAGERDVVQARRAGRRVEDEGLEVGVVEVAVGHRHRLAPVALHDQQRPRVVVGRQQRDLAADELGVLARPAALAQERHLAVDLGGGVVAVGADPLRLLAVVARGAREVAAREDAVRALAAGRAAAEHLLRRLDVVRELGPAPRERLGQVGVLGTGEHLEGPQAFGQRHRP